ncbi:hypothetical protein [Pontibacillus sp. HMF3514]|uniref:hypothetical protein n=1 Tax=Pontibacillus sp. HMF3514 TaxID=2692425 RepID=UPI00131F75FE|nr:hypothetical protein [Pontibacillus sp. HMF3514]QHE53304.1 hypothetical protein GS400_15305 [Pontibacillus sp. HMF3514]
MIMLTKLMELIVLATVGVMFIGYSLFLYPIEKIQEKTSKEVKQNKVKYAPRTKTQTAA